MSAASDDEPDGGRGEAPRLMWMGYPRADEGLARLQALFDASPDPSRAPGMLIYGQTNNGKTTLVRWFETRMNGTARRGRERDEIPVVYAQTPPGPDIGHACTLILNAVNAPVARTGTRERRTTQTIDTLSRLRTRMLILDEIHNIHSGPPNKQQEYLNFLKLLTNQLGIPIVAIGTEAARFATQTDQQIGNRLEPFAMPPWQRDADYAMFATRVFGALGIDAAGLMRKARPLEKVHVQTGGLTGETWAFARRIKSSGRLDPGGKLTTEALDPPGWTAPDDRR